MGRGQVRGARHVGVAVMLVVAAAGFGLALMVAGPPSTARASQLRAADATLGASLSEYGFFYIVLDSSFAGFSSDAQAHVEYGTTPAYGSQCCDSYVQAGTNPGFRVAALQDGTTYHLRIVATSSGVTYYSNDVTATTSTTGPPLIRFRNGPDYEADFGCFLGTAEIDTKGYDTSWWAAAGADLSHPTTSDVQVQPGIPFDVGYVWGGFTMMRICPPFQSAGSLIYLQLHASSEKGSGDSPTVTFTVPASTTTAPAPTTTTTTVAYPPDEERPTMSSTVLPTGFVGTPYRVVLPLSKGSPPYTVALNGPEERMPPGLQLESNGVVDGTPLSDGRFPVNIQVFDQRYTPRDGAASVFTLTIPISQASTTTASTTTTQTPRPKLVLPKPSLTPGATNSAVKQSTIRATICVSGWTKTIRPPVSYTNALKLKQMKQYGEKGSPSLYEEDNFIPLELGGAPKNPKNLWPEPHSQSKHSDVLETSLKRKVCAGSLTLAAARKQIVAYKRTHG